MKILLDMDIWKKKVLLNSRSHSESAVLRQMLYSMVEVCTPSASHYIYYYSASLLDFYLLYLFLLFIYAHIYICMYLCLRIYVCMYVFESLKSYRMLLLTG